MPGYRPGDVQAAVAAELDRLAPAGGAGGGIGVAVSGGSDSTALLLIAQRWAGAWGTPVRVATVDHGLRRESATEAAAVGALCTGLGLAHEVLHTGDLRAGGGNLSAAAREARLALLAGWAARHGLAAVLLGHTLDDQAETVLMRLARGSGAEGLAAMAPAVRHHATLWLRPLLGQRREALRAFLGAEGVGWAEDPSNDDPGYDRVKARRALAALAPLGIAPEGLARTAGHLARQRRVLDRAMAALAGRARGFGPLGEARLDLAEMAADEEDTALRLLADTLRAVAGGVYRPRFAALASAWRALAAGRNRAMTLGGCLILPAARPGVALVCREPAACEGPVALAPGLERGAVWDRRWRVSLAGAWPEGARLAALGRAGRAALKAAGHDAWTPPKPWAAAPAVVRETTPALWSAAGAGPPVLLAAPLAGYLDRDRTGAGCTVSAERVDSRELPSGAAPD